MTARAFILENGKLSTEAVEKHAERVFLFDRLPSPLFPRDVLETIREKLAGEDYNPDDDFIVLTGSPVQLSMLVLAAWDLSICESFQVLVFDSRSDSYVAKEVSFS